MAKGRCGNIGGIQISDQIKTNKGLFLKQSFVQ